MHNDWAVSDRVSVVKIRGKPLDINIIQVYTSTSGRDEDEVDQLNAVVDQCKSHEITIVMCNINAKMGKSSLEEAVGPFGLGERNKRGEK